MYAREVNAFKHKHIKFTPLDKKGKRTKIKYCQEVCAFDIETTNIDKYKQSIMYIWQFQYNDHWTIYGRTWDSFQDFLKKLENKIPAGCYAVILVHNLSFEWQWLKSVIPIDEVFAMDDRKILYFRSGKFEFRCSYLHSNMSLDKYLQKMDVKSKKVKGFDYTKKRYPWTKLSSDDLLYCFNDVRGLVQAYKEEMKRDGDDLYSVPYTSTGYSRRLAKAAIGPYRRYIKGMLPDAEIFDALRRSFRGGNTHANRWNANIILEAEPGAPIMSYDIASSYPAVMLEGIYPRKFTKTDISKFNEYYQANKACLFRVYLQDVKLRDDATPVPYLAKAKCEYVHDGQYDNGRILKADRLECYINEIDWRIILQQYDFQYEIIQLWTATKSPLPQSFKDLIMHMYHQKTLLKGGDEYLYGKYKNLINAMYGMMVMNPCKVQYEFIDGEMQVKDDSIEELILEYQKHGWLPYQWGCWVTSYARLRLQRAIDMIDPNDFIYCDTDSVKFMGDYSKEFSALNESLYDPAYSALDTKGKEHPLGIFEKDAEYKRFKTMGAKKYAYESMDGSLHLTISGVSKSKGPKELKKLENFKEGFIFREAGGMCSLYNDHPEVTSVRIQGHTLPIISNVALFPSTYTLGLTEEYSRLIRYLMNTDIRASLHYER